MTASRILRQALTFLCPARGRAGRYPRGGVPGPRQMIAAGCRS